MSNDEYDEHPKVCVVVPCYNEEDKIGACLEALKDQTYPNHEIMVVDDDSKDDSPRIVREQGVRLIRLTTNNGVARARNVGIKYCRAGIIAFTDADCVVETGWLEKLIRAMESQNLDVVMGRKIKPLNSNSFIVRAQTGGRPIKRVRNESLGGGYSVAYKKEVFNELGGFNEKLRRGCEYEFTLRVLRSRFKFGWAEDATVKFTYADTIIGLWKQEFSNGFWLKEIMRSHPYFLKRRIKDLLARALVIIFPFLYILILLKNWREYEDIKILLANGAIMFLRSLSYYSGLLLSIFIKIFRKDIIIKYK